MEENKELLLDFIQYLSEKDDVFYAFDNPDKVTEEFLKQR